MTTSQTNWNDTANAIMLLVSDHAGIHFKLGSAQPEQVPGLVGESTRLMVEIANKLYTRLDQALKPTAAAALTPDAPELPAESGLSAYLEQTVDDRPPLDDEEPLPTAADMCQPRLLDTGEWGIGTKDCAWHYAATAERVAERHDEWLAERLSLAAISNGTELTDDAKRALRLAYLLNTRGEKPGPATNIRIDTHSIYAGTRSHDNDGNITGFDTTGQNISIEFNGDTAQWSVIFR